MSVIAPMLANTVSSPSLFEQAGVDSFVLFLGANADWLTLSIIGALFICGFIGFILSRQKVQQEVEDIDTWTWEAESIEPSPEHSHSRRPLGNTRRCSQRLLLRLFNNWCTRKDIELIDINQVSLPEEDDELPEEGEEEKPSLGDEMLRRLQTYETNCLKNKQEPTLLEERLLLITSMVNEDNNVSFMPHISELHELSLQRMESDRWSKMLTLATAVILVCGICGTLWSVHYRVALAEPGEVLDMQEFSHCLIPSFCAVLANVALIILRTLLAKGLDTCLGELDNLTLAHFTPALQPKSYLNQLLESFQEKVNPFHEQEERTERAHACQLPFKNLSLIPKALLHARETLTTGVDELLKAIGGHIRNCASMYAHLATLYSLQAWQREQFLQLAQAVETSATLLSLIRQEQDRTGAYLDELQQLCHFSRADLGGAFSLHATACKRLEHAKIELEQILSRLRQWKQDCDATCLTTNKVQELLNAGLSNTQDLVDKAEELRTNSEKIGQRLLEIQNDSIPALLANAGGERLYSPTSAAAARYDEQFGGEAQHIRKGMVSYARQFTEHNLGFNETRVGLQRNLFDFVNGSASLSSWPKVLYCLVVFSIICVEVAVCFYIGYLLSPPVQRFFVELWQTHFTP